MGRQDVLGLFPDAEVSPFSVLIPVHNEARILENALSQMIVALRDLHRPFELLICENGSTDRSLDLAHALALRYPEVVVEHVPVADYGRTLSYGITKCRHPFIVIYNVDFWSAPFAREALFHLRSCDLVLGSKVMPGATDQRPLVRRFITHGFNAFLRLVFGFRGTDTHGMKALQRPSVLRIVDACVTDGWIFDTELVLRVQRAGLRIREIPVNTREIRQPGYWAIIRRFPPVLLALLKLWRSLRQERTGVTDS